MKTSNWYAWVALVVTLLLSIVANVLVSTHAAERAVAAQQASQRQATEAGRRATCNVVLTQLAIYDVVPPTTKIQQEAFRAWTGMHDLYQCSRG